MVIAHLNAPLAFNIKARKKLTFHCNQWNEKTASLGLSWSNEELAHNSVVVYWYWFWWKLHLGKEVRATYLTASRTDGFVNQIKLKIIIDQIVQGHLKLGHGIGTYQMPNKLKCNEEVGLFFLTIKEYVIIESQFCKLYFGLLMGSIQSYLTKVTMIMVRSRSWI